MKIVNLMINKKTDELRKDIGWVHSIDNEKKKEGFICDKTGTTSIIPNLSNQNTEEIVNIELLATKGINDKDVKVELLTEAVNTRLVNIDYRRPRVLVSPEVRSNDILFYVGSEVAITSIKIDSGASVLSNISDDKKSVAIAIRALGKKLPRVRIYTEDKKMIMYSYAADRVTVVNVEHDVTNKYGIVRVSPTLLDLTNKTYKITNDKTKKSEKGIITKGGVEREVEIPCIFSKFLLNKNVVVIVNEKSNIIVDVEDATMKNDITKKLENKEA